MTTSNKYSLDNLDKRFFFNQELIEQSFLNQNLDISLTHVDDFEFTVEVLSYGDCFATILDKIYAIAIESFWSKRKFKICPIQTQSEVPFFMNEPIFVDVFLIHSCKTKAVLEVFVYQSETDIFNETVEII
ncbi:hypothetical protein GCM10011514_49750 [Emticicia aquatilis]|uniref:Uncharacterized protein n=1 Tax=Emticicia aquatilis TaxID=1537369 RepID=A0A916Z860_9BACT|nr:hypothetical protein [Emticicia aquatilis]GGD79810.1 hypothetical protein GCM10011514_49750 [Emticicia aquatilis]